MIRCWFQPWRDGSSRQRRAAWKAFVLRDKRQGGKTARRQDGNQEAHPVRQPQVLKRKLTTVARAEINVSDSCIWVLSSFNGGGDLASHAIRLPDRGTGFKLQPCEYPPSAGGKTLRLRVIPGACPRHGIVALADCPPITIIGGHWIGRAGQDLAPSIVLTIRARAVAVMGQRQAYPAAICASPEYSGIGFLMAPISAAGPG